MSTTPPAADILFDVASAMSQGRREYQEDSLATDFPPGSDLGVAVLADGMGGHVAGDVASALTVSEVFAELQRRQQDPVAFRSDIPGALRRAVDHANRRLGEHTRRHPQSAGMGATVVALVFDTYGLYWISVGDSPLYLFRDGVLRQMNEDHSLAPQIDFLVAQGMLDPEIGRTHPDRHCLTSVLIGQGIDRIDCAERAFPLEDGDIVIVASDGLQSLDDRTIAALLHDMQDFSSERIAQRLLDEVDACLDPDQDNVSLAVVRTRFPRARRRKPPVQPGPRRQPAPDVVPAASRSRFGKARTAAAGPAPVPVHSPVAGDGRARSASRWLRDGFDFLTGRQPGRFGGKT